MRLKVSVPEKICLPPSPPRQPSANFAFVLSISRPPTQPPPQLFVFFVFMTMFFSSLYEICIRPLPKVDSSSPCAASSAAFRIKN
ncbi:hypothetical protein INR49_022427, partial [Caranx melampygus]